MESLLSAVELFAGIGGFRIASDRLNLVTKCANDICPKACAVYRDRFGDKEMREGDLHSLLADIPDHDVLTGGFPCQPFSSAGKKRGIEDPRGTLFELIVHVLKARAPRFFVLENVKRLLHMDRGAHFATILDTLAALDYTIEWRLLNAMNLGLPQNRQRVFIVGIKKANQESAAPPIHLATAHDFDGISQRATEFLEEPALWSDISDHGESFPSWGLASDGKFWGCDLDRVESGLPTVRLREVLEPLVGSQFDFTDATMKWIAENTPVNKFVDGVEILSNQRGGARMGYTIFGIHGVAPTLTCTTSRHYERYLIDNRYRRLTNIEYARIQGFPDDHCRVSSIYDQYQLFGNAVPPPMAEWVLNRLINTTPAVVTGPATLFSGTPHAAY